MKIFTSQQIREIDAYTIAHEPIASVDLMERAAGALFGWIKKQYGKEQPFVIFAGQGNNGGDALALARMLINDGYAVYVYCLCLSENFSADCAVNLERLKQQSKTSLVYVRKISDINPIPTKAIIIDGLFGTGLSRPIEGTAAEIIRMINNTGNTIISIDMPSGLFGEDNRHNIPEHIIKAHYTLTFEFPKLSFMFASNAVYTGKWEVLPIGLHQQKIQQEPSPYFFTDNEFAASNIKRRPVFSHKGNYGHALLVAGSYGKMGAAILSSRACLKTGVGLLHCHIPKKGYQIIQAAVPEAMASIDKGENIFSSLPKDAGYNALGIGPGLGTEKKTQRIFLQLLKKYRLPMVIDADALNILGINKKWLRFLPPYTILTPHPKEFERLFGSYDNAYEQLQAQCLLAREYGIIIILKGAYSSIALPDGSCFFNSTGNPGMATAGSGDVLTGIILSLLSQQYPPAIAAVLGVYIHGMAGDLAVAEIGQEALIAGDIVDYIGDVFMKIKNAHDKKI